ncbi:hypothetical protein D8674_024298 [Pyrus ussuriensis x Pyrus communis]|uniref:Protein FAR-RED-ELONGATED HYPOCOTYL 1-LIKE-like n=1 Tax=Pyrus ussuriensis x Pyrus communis TaxID=2448454 RepID=A0A5N5H2J3_9ROSA|nr:hypothetical protein D8674_024298 [Pyrus ussuriensis x Pyrus communis]
MEGFKENPSEIHSFPVINVISPMKKRKFHEEQLGLPTPKHRCWARVFPSDESVSTFDGNLEIKNMQKQTLNRKIDGASMDDRSEPESGGGSNSFAGDSGYATLVYGDSKVGPVYAQTCQYDRPSTSSGNGISHSADELKYEFGKRMDYIFAEYGDDCIEQCMETGCEDLIYPNGLKPNTYVLSSGRWSVDQGISEGQSAGSSRKPTIDQEFEQYFSSLML